MLKDAVYRYTDPKEFLALALEEKKRINPCFSLRAWARQIGFKTPSLLSAILRGDRRLKPPVAARILKTLRLSADEARYFELLVLLSNATSAAEKELYLSLLHQQRPQLRHFHLDLEKFRLISDWYHWAILEMVDLADFREDIDYIARRAGGISSALAKAALERLLRLGLLTRDEDGKLVKAKGEMRIGDDVPSEAIRNHHVQMIERAEKALRERPVDERDFRGSTFAIRADDYARAKEIIRKFHAELRKLSDQGAAEDVYRFNTQFFRLTTGRPETPMVAVAASEIRREMAVTSEGAR